MCRSSITDNNECGCLLLQYEVRIKLTVFNVLNKQQLKSHPVLPVQVWRGEVKESEHLVHAVLVDESRQVVASWGDSAYKTTARSALKPFQLLSNLTNGASEKFQFTEQELAFMCASHNGESMHTDLCLSLLQKIGQGEQNLLCGSHDPYHQESAIKLYQQQKKPTAIHNNCSGKHCGMLAHASLVPSSLSYLDREHPTQQGIFNLLAELLGKEKPIKWGTDGCSLPTPELYLSELAYLFTCLAAGQCKEQKQYSMLKDIFLAMSNHPHLVAGQGRFDTAFMNFAAGAAVCKVGGEAIRGFALRLPEGSFGLVVKVQDGAMRALHPACLQLCIQLGILNEEDLSKELKAFLKGQTFNWANRLATHILFG